VQAPDWSLMDDATRIERRFRFKDFGEAFAFVSHAAELAEAEGHHPDITFGWGYAAVSLRTKKIKGLHENDFIMGAVAGCVGNGRGCLRRDDGIASGGEVNHALGGRLTEALPAIDLAHADLT
jgi:pterin-4a-carbinolamine dehydratase